MNTGRPDITSGRFVDACKYMETPYTGNCADLVRDVLRDEFGVTLDIPQFGDVSDENRAQAVSIVDHYRALSVKVNEPRNGDIALMMANGLPAHIGVYANGRVLHLVDGQRVANTPVGRLRLISRPLVGFYRL